MAQLPADRTKLALAQGNQIPSTTASSTKNIQAMTEAYDTIDALYNFTTALISAGTLSRLGVINVRDYNASGSAQTTTGSITAGTNRLTVASAIDFAVGQGIAVSGAGAAGADLISTISSINGLVVTLAANASTTVSVAAVRHDDSAAFANVLAVVSTSEYTEAVPTVPPLGKIEIPAGIYNISSVLNITSYISIEGMGRDTTILASYITDGSPVLNVSHNDVVKEQQFYNTIKALTISGRSQNCIGIKLNSTSRWILDEVMINGTSCEGLYMYESYLGEVRSCLIRACGDGSHPSVMLSGRDANYGSHAVSFFGGEIDGGTGVVDGVYLKYGTSVGFFGVTIEGFADGIGLINENGNSLVVNGCYFEANKEDIVETGPTLGTNYTGNFFGPAAGTSGRGQLGIYYAQACKIEGNYFTGASSVKIFDSTPGATGRLHMSSVRTNYTPSFPISMSASLITSAQQSGTVIETFDGGFYNYVYGRQKFKDIVLFEGEMRATVGLQRIGTTATPGDATSSSILGGTGSPAGVVSAPVGSLYLRKDGGTGTSLYVKETGSGSTGWVAK